MKWGSFLVKAIVILIVMWAIAIYVYGDFVLADSVVPERGVGIDEWLDSYYKAGAISAFWGLVCSCIWFYFGTHYSGGAGISIKFWVPWIVSLVLGIATAFFVIEKAVDGSGASFIFAALMAPVGYYLIALFDSAEAVKYIPPLGMMIHK